MIFSKMSDLKTGDIVEITGFTCIDDHVKIEVQCNPSGELYVHCADGTHMLNGQTIMNEAYGGGDILVGVTKV